MLKNIYFFRIFSTLYPRSIFLEYFSIMSKKNILIKKSVHNLGKEKSQILNKRVVTLKPIMYNHTALKSNTQMVCKNKHCLEQM